MSVLSGYESGSYSYRHGAGPSLPGFVGRYFFLSLVVQPGKFGHATIHTHSEPLSLCVLGSFRDTTRVFETIALPYRRMSEIDEEIRDEH